MRRMLDFRLRDGTTMHRRGGGAKWCVGIVVVVPSLGMAAPRRCAVVNMCLRPAADSENSVVYFDVDSLGTRKSLASRYLSFRESARHGKRARISEFKQWRINGG